jgi:Ni,Fe-hydrogenase III small subunit
MEPLPLKQPPCHRNVGRFSRAVLLLLTLISCCSGSLNASTLPSRGLPDATADNQTTLASSAGLWSGFLPDGFWLNSSRVPDPDPVFDSPPTPANDSYSCIASGQVYSVTIQAHSPKPGRKVQIVSGSVPFGSPTFTPALPTPAANTTSTNLTVTATGFGPQHLSFTARDETGEIAQTDWDVIIDAPPFFISAPSPLTINAGQTFTYLITCGDPDLGSGDALTFKELVLPSWLTLTRTGPTTAILTGTPGSGNVGLNHVAIQVIDLYGQCFAPVIQDFNIKVIPCINATISALPSGGVYCPGTHVELSASSATSYSWSTGATTQSIHVVANGTSVFSVTTIAGPCISTASITIRGIDTIPPQARCKNISVDLDHFGKAFITASDVNNGSSDNCEIESIKVWPDHFDCSNIGPNTVTLTVTDGSGNKDKCTAIVTVEDEIKPEARCKNISVDLNHFGKATISGGDVDNGSSDNCSIKSITVSPDHFDCSNIGPNTVTLTVTDESGNTDKCTAIVTVEDEIKPEAKCKSISVDLDASGHASITAAQIDNGSSDNCSIKSMTVSPDHFDCSNLGPNTVTLTVVDESGNTDKCTATVTVEDEIKPEAKCKSISVDLDASGHASITAAQIDNGSYDNCSIKSMTVSPDHFDCSILGPNTVTLTVVDESGNTDKCTATVTVEDEIKPEAKCKSISVDLDASGHASITASQVDNGSTDNCSIKSMTVVPDHFDCSNLGPNTVTLTVVDESGNFDKCTATVTVEDEIKPEANCKSISVDLDSTGHASITAAQINNGSSDNCSIKSMSVVPDHFDCSNLGPNTVTLTVVDESGNTDKCAATVTVEDEIKPEAKCKSISVDLDSTGHASITAAQINNGSSDNCSIKSMSVVPDHFDCSNLGPNSVTLTVVDESGNFDKCTATVTVEDEIKPEAKCKSISVDLDSTGHASITAAQINNGSSDNCSIKSMSVAPDHFDCSNLGPNTVTLTVVDESGNTDKCSATVKMRSNRKRSAKASQ